MAQIYFLIFWIPATAAAVALRIAWGAGILRQPLLLLLWFVAALAAQGGALKFSPLWAAGLVSQVILALYLLLRLKIDG